MEKLKHLIDEHKKAALFGLFFLIVFIGGSAVSAINVAQHRAEQQEQVETSEDPISPEQNVDSEHEKVELSTTQKKAIEGYDDDTKALINILSASVWSANGGRNTLRLSNDSYVESVNGETTAHSYAITRIDKSSDGYGGSLYTIVFETDTGTHIVSYVDGKGSAVQNVSGDVVKTDSSVIASLSSASMFSQKDTPYERADAIENITVKGMNSEITELLGNNANELTSELSKWCAVHYPSVTEATWNKVASIDYDAQAVTTGFTLNTDNPLELTVIYMTDTGEFSFGR